MEQILIIEDDFSLNQGLCRALKQEERQLIPCPNLKTAREQLLCSDPSLVLLDINLPDGSGLDFLREIKTSSPLRPVILLTANDTDMDIVNGLEQGADDYITKPFSLSVLRARVNTQLRKKNSRADSIFRDYGFVFDFERMQLIAWRRLCMYLVARPFPNNYKHNLALICRGRHQQLSRASLFF